MRFTILKFPDSRLDCPLDQLAGVYYVMKKRTVARFEFGQPDSPHSDITSAHNALTEFLANRKDADKLSVQLLNRNQRGN